MRHSPSHFLALCLFAFPAWPATLFKTLEPVEGWSHDLRPYGISHDGLVVVGVANNGVSDVPFRWVLGRGMEPLVGYGTGQPSGQANDVSADGSRAVGSTLYSPEFAPASRWLYADEVVALGSPPVSSFANGISSDGQVVVGSHGTSAFRWTEDGGMVSLGFLPGGTTSSTAAKTSRDGSVVVGRSDSANGPSEAFRWTEAGGMQGLGLIPSGPGGPTAYSLASDVSADGNTVVGVSEHDSISDAFRWTPGEGMTVLGHLPDSSNSDVMGVSADGSVIVGESIRSGGADGAYRWTAAHGMESVRDLLVARGVNLDDWNLIAAYAVSGDGNVIAGYGSGPNGPSGWVAYIDYVPVYGVPEPGSAGLALLGAVVARGLRRGRRAELEPVPRRARRRSARRCRHRY